MREREGRMTSDESQHASPGQMHFHRDEQVLPAGTTQGSSRGYLRFVLGAIGSFLEPLSISEGGEYPWHNEFD